MTNPNESKGKKPSKDDLLRRYEHIMTPGVAPGLFVILPLLEDMKKYIEQSENPPADGEGFKKLKTWKYLTKEEQREYENVIEDVYMELQSQKPKVTRKDLKDLVDRLIVDEHLKEQAMRDALGWACEHGVEVEDEKVT